MSVKILVISVCILMTSLPMGLSPVPIDTLESASQPQPSQNQGSASSHSFDNGLVASPGSINLLPDTFSVQEGEVLDIGIYKMKITTVSESSKDMPNLPPWILVRMWLPGKLLGPGADESNAISANVAVGQRVILWHRFEVMLLDVMGKKATIKVSLKEGAGWNEITAQPFNTMIGGQSSSEFPSNNVQNSVRSRVVR